MPLNGVPAAKTCWLGVPIGVWQMLVAAVVTITLSWMQVHTQAVVAKVEQVAVDTHTLVNSNQGTQLKLHAGTAKRLAILSNDPVDAEIAKQAEAAVADHEKAQGTVDAGKKPRD